jgi:hypothetical protein
MDEITVARLGYIVQVLFEMTASHLMAIEVPQDENFRIAWKHRHPDMSEEKYSNIFADSNKIWRYEIMDEDFEPSDIPDTKDVDATKTRLRHAVCHIGDR